MMVANVSYVRAVAEEIGEKLNRDIIVVVKSTVPVGTNDWVESVIEEGLNKRG